MDDKHRHKYSLSFVGHLICLDRVRVCSVLGIAKANKDCLSVEIAVFIVKFKISYQQS